MPFNDITVKEYTSNSIVVQGDTRKYKEDLKKLGGKYNGQLKNGPGWIFTKSAEKELNVFIKNGKRLVTNDEIKEGEERSRQRAKEWESTSSNRVDKTKLLQSKPVPVHVSNKLFGSNVSPTLTEYGAMMSLIKNMSTKIELLEHGILMLLTDDQKEAINVLMKPPEKKGVVKKIIKRETQEDNEDSEDIDECDSDSEEEEIPRRRLMR
jgi:hypothetical protein